MAVIVHATDPAALLQAIRAAIKDGSVQTWSVDSDGDFTHSPDQWRLKAWFRPKTADGRIIFRILTPQKTTMTKVTYAVYHGRFIEMLLNHFDTQFQNVSASALPTEGDQVKSQV
jgi:hypothetical protein